MTQPADTIKTWATDVGVRPAVAGASNVQAALAALGGASGIVSQDFVFSEGATAGGHLFAIVAVDVPANTVTVAGSHVNDLDGCTWIVIEGSTGNDGIYGIRSSIYDPGPDQTVATLTDILGDPTNDGTLRTAGYLADITLVAGAVVVFVEMFNETAWAADAANLYVASHNLTYFSAQDLLAALQSVGGVSVSDNAFVESPSTGAGPLYVEVLTTVANPPVVPTGNLTVRVWYSSSLVQAPIVVPFT